MILFKNTKQTMLILGTNVLSIVSMILVLSLGNAYEKNTQDKRVESQIELTTDKVIIAVGDDFNAKDYVAKATNSYGEDISGGIVSPEIDTSVPGTYEVVFTFKEGEEVIKSQTLKVVVAEK